MKINTFLYFIVLISLSSFSTDLSTLENVLMRGVDNDDCAFVNEELININQNYTNADPDQRYLLSPLQKAASFGKNEMFCILLRYARSEFITKYGEALLHGFFSFWHPNKRWPLAIQVLQRGVSPNIVNAGGRGLLHCAAEEDLPHEVEYLINVKANLNIEDSVLHCTPLHYSVLNKNLEITKLLLEAQASLKAQGPTKRTPLHLACIEKNQTEMVSLLLSYGADPEVKDAEGRSSCSIAIDNKDMKVLKLLKNRQNHASKASTKIGAYKKNSIHNLGKNALSLTSLADPLLGAIFINDVEKVTEYLHTNPLQGHKVFDDGDTALHWAIKQADAEIVELLLKNNAQADFRNNDGKTARELTNNLAIINIFQQHLNKLDIDALENAYYTSIPDAVLALPPQNKLIDVKISFNRTAHKIIFSFDKTELLRSELKLSFKKKPEQGFDRVVFQKTDKLPLIFDGIATHDKKKKPIKGRFWFVSDLVLLKENSQLFLRGKTNHGGDFSWALATEANHKETSELKQTPSLKIPKKPDLNPIIKVESPKNYPSMAELHGLYQGELQNEVFEVSLPVMDTMPQRLDLSFKVVKSNGKTEQNLLWTRPLTDLLGHTVGFEPLSGGEKPKFVPNQTTWNGQRIGGKKNAQLRFKSHLRVAEKIEGQPLSLSIETHRGMLVLTKQRAQIKNEQPRVTEIDLDDLLETNNDNEAEAYFEDDDRAPVEIEMALDDEEDPVEENVPQQPVAPTQKKKTKRVKKSDEEYTVTQSNEERKQYGRIGYSADENEKFERERVRLTEKMLELGEQRQKEDDLHVWRKNAPTIANNSFKLEHIAQEPQYLNARSSFVDNPLYQEDMMWFADGWEKSDDGAFRPNIFLNFAFSLKNLNELEQFAPQASWCSLFKRAEGDNNFQNGMNVHCSYHENNDKKYLNISHFGLFLIERDHVNGRYLLYQVPAPGSNERIAYVLRPLKEMRSKWKKGNKILSPVETLRRYVNCHDDVAKIMGEKECQYRRKNMACHLERELQKEPLLLTYKNKLFYAVFDADNDQSRLILMNHQPWRKIEYWHVEMINDKLAFISILFINSHGNLEAITIKKIVH